MDSRLPEGASFWVPKPSEISEEGFGFFRDVWPMVGVSARTARQVVGAERAVVDFIDAHAATEEEFYALARAADIGNDFEEDEVSPWPGEFPPTGASPWPGLSGLDLGVAGLVHALSSVKVFPAASSRGGERWSEMPIVFVALDEPRARMLQPLVAAVGCGFSIDRARSELLVIEGPSVVEMMDLARLVLDRGAEFRKLPKTSRRQSSPRRRRDPPATLF